MKKALSRPALRLALLEAGRRRWLRWPARAPGGRGGQFAKSTSAGGALSRVSTAMDNTRFIPIEQSFQSTNEAIATARAELSRGKKHREEAYLVVGNKIVGAAAGGADYLDARGLNKRVRGGDSHFIHNHPMKIGLSPDDVEVMVRNGYKSIVAVTPGRTYSLTAVREKPKGVSGPEWYGMASQTIRASMDYNHRRGLPGRTSEEYTDNLMREMMKTWTGMGFMTSDGVTHRMNEYFRYEESG